MCHPKARSFSSNRSITPLSSPSWPLWFVAFPLPFSYMHQTKNKRTPLPIHRREDAPNTLPEGSPPYHLPTALTQPSDHLFWWAWYQKTLFFISYNLCPYYWSRLSYSLVSFREIYSFSAIFWPNDSESWDKTLPKDSILQQLQFKVCITYILVMLWTTSSKLQTRPLARFTRHDKWGVPDVPSSGLHSEYIPQLVFQHRFWFYHLFCN